MKGIIAKFECKGCGNLVVLKDVLKSTASGHSFRTPKKCVCSGGTSFELLTFEPAETMVLEEKIYEKVKDYINQKVQEKDENQE